MNKRNTKKEKKKENKKFPYKSRRKSSDTKPKDLNTPLP